jgi:hypothetical protein
MSAPAYDENCDLHDSYYAAVAELRRRYLAGQLSLADWTASGWWRRGTQPVRRQRGDGHTTGQTFPLRAAAGGSREAR